MARTQGQKVPSFFKVMYGKDFDKIMYIPPKAALLLSELNGRKTYLEDSSGEKWEVSVSKVKGSLAFRQGWNDFFTGHGLEYGDFVVLNYTGAYFDVEVYNKSAIQREGFKKSSQTKKRTRMDQQCSNPPNDRTELNNESDEEGKRSSAKRRHTRNDRSQLKRGNAYGGKRKTRRVQDKSQSSRSDPSDSESNAVEIGQPQFKRQSIELDGDNTESPSLYRGSEDRAESERNSVERDDFEEMPQFTRQNAEGPSLDPGSTVRTQSERNTVERNDFEETPQFKGQNVESPSLHRGSRVRTRSERNTVERDDFEETPQFQRQSVETDGGVREHPSSYCIKKAEIQPKREFFEDSFFGSAWDGANNTHNEARTAVLDLSEFELWGGCSNNQSAGIKAAAVRNGFGDKDQGTSSRDVRTNETSNYASEVAARVEAGGEMFQNNRSSAAPITTKKDKGHVLSGDHPREPEPTETTASPVSVAANDRGHMMSAYNQRVPPAVSGVAVPIVKKERVGADTAQGAAVPVVKKERTGAGALPFNLPKNEATAQGTDQKPPVAAKPEPKVETFTDLPQKPLRAVATNPSFLELPSELPGEIPHGGKVTNRIVILQDSVMRLWPVLYNSDTTRKVLHSEGWEGFCNANDVQLGDECVLQFKGSFTYAASVVKKQPVT